MRNAPQRFEADRRYPGPGVYFEETAPGKAAPFRTGRPAFIGVAQPASENRSGESCRPFQPYWLTGWDQFTDRFGVVTGAFLADAVRGFFANGGEACVVVSFPLEHRALGGDENAAWSRSVRRCLERLERVDDVDLLCAPDLPVAEPARLDLQRTLLEHCRTMADRFAILDPAPNATVEGVVRQWHELVSTDGALYFPWLRTPAAGIGSRLVPPCGHVAGVFARTDARIGVHKPPANEPVDGVVDVQVAVSDDDQRLLNHVGVNSVRPFPGRGIRVWGARTLSGRAEWRYVNVRRLFLTLKRWLDARGHELVFEPNDSRLWSQVADGLRIYCYDLFRAGALKGVSFEEAFYVKCDAETNSAAARDRGEVIAEVGLAPARPAEFVAVRITQSATGASIVPVTRTTEGS